MAGLHAPAPPPPPLPHPPPPATTTLPLRDPTRHQHHQRRRRHPTATATATTAAHTRKKNPYAAPPTKPTRKSSAVAAAAAAAAAASSPTRLSLSLADASAAPVAGGGDAAHLLARAAALLSACEADDSAASLSAAAARVAHAVAAACAADPPQFAAARRLLRRADATVAAAAAAAAGGEKCEEEEEDDDAVAARAELCSARGVLARQTGNLPEAAARCLASVRLYRSLHARDAATLADVAGAELSAAASLGKLGDHGAAVQHAAAAVRVARAALAEGSGVRSGEGAGGLLAAACYNLAVELHHDGCPEESRAAIEEAARYAGRYLPPLHPAAGAIADFRRCPLVAKLPSSVVSIRAMHGVHKRRASSLLLPNLQHASAAAAAAAAAAASTAAATTQTTEASREAAAQTGVLPPIHAVEGVRGGGRGDGGGVCGGHGGGGGGDECTEYNASGGVGEEEGTAWAVALEARCASSPSGASLVAPSPSPSPSPPVGGLDPASFRSKRPRRKSEAAAAAAAAAAGTGSASAGEGADPAAARGALHHQLGARNVAMSRAQYGPTFKKAQKHLAALAGLVTRARDARQAAACTLQRMVRCFAARLERYNRQQLLYQILHDKQSSVCNLAKGRTNRRRARKIVSDRQTALAEHHKARAAAEVAADRAACCVQRAWLRHRERAREALRTRVFQQALVESRSLGIRAVCPTLQRWWRWVCLRKRHWRRRGRTVAEEAVQRLEARKAVAGATKIQATWRMVLDRRYAARMRERAERLRLHRQAQLPCATDIVRFVLRSVSIRARWAAEKAARPAPPREAALRDGGVAVLSRVFAGAVARVRLAAAARRRCAAGAAAAVLQRLARRRRAVRERRARGAARGVLLRAEQAGEAAREGAALAAQRCVRRFLARTAERRRRARRGREVIEAVWAVQRAWRAWRARVALRTRRAARARRVAAAAEEEREGEAAAVREVGRRVSARLAATDRLEEEAEVERCRLVARVLAGQELRAYDARLVLQKVARAFAGRRRLAAEQRAAATVQGAWRRRRAARVRARRRSMRGREAAARAVAADLAHEVFVLRAADLHAEAAEGRAGVAAQEERRRGRLARRRYVAVVWGEGAEGWCGGGGEEESGEESLSDGDGASSGCYD